MIKWLLLLFKWSCLLQILTDLQVFISIEILVEMFMLGTTSLQKVVFQKVSCDKPETNLKTEVGEDDDEKDEEKEKDADDPVDEVHSSSCEEHLKCYLIMLDVLLKQVIGYFMMIIMIHLGTGQSSPLLLF